MKLRLTACSTDMGRQPKGHHEVEKQNKVLGRVILMWQINTYQTAVQSRGRLRLCVSGETRNQLPPVALRSKSLLSLQVRRVVAMFFNYCQENGGRTARDS